MEEGSLRPPDPEDQDESAKVQAGNELRKSGVRVSSHGRAVRVRQFLEIMVMLGVGFGIALSMVWLGNWLGPFIGLVWQCYLFASVWIASTAIIYLYRRP